MGAFSSQGFPKTVTLRNGVQVVLRPLDAGDAEPLHDFFVALPVADRHFMKDDVAAPETARQWAAVRNRSNAMSLIAIDGSRIVADAAMLRHRGPARQHQAEVRVTILPEFQGNGLGTLLVRELAEIAWEADIEMLEFELVEGIQAAAIEAMRGVGAFHVATLEDYLRDADGKPCNLAYYRLPLSAWFSF